MIILTYPLALLLLVVPFVLYWTLPAVKGMHGDALKVPFLADLKRITITSGSIWQQSSSLPREPKKIFWGVYAIWVLLVLAAARPQILGEPIRLKNESRDIMLVLDISTSMLEPDFAYAGRRVTRLDAVRKVVSDFADKRANDRLGLILFGTRAYLQAPLTFDKAGVKDILWSMQAGMAGDSTSIGDALALALKNLRENKEDKVIILLTDGENNDGSLSLAQATKLAQDENIKIYTIGVGSPNTFFQMFSLAAVGVDEQELKQLAAITEGRYFRAQSTQDLQEVYNLIDKLEPSVSDERYVRETTELYFIPLLSALVVALILAFVQRRG